MKIFENQPFVLFSFIFLRQQTNFQLHYNFAKNGKRRGQDMEHNQTI